MPKINSIFSEQKFKIIHMKNLKKLSRNDLRKLDGGKLPVVYGGPCGYNGTVYATCAAGTGTCNTNGGVGVATCQLHG